MKTPLISTTLGLSLTLALASPSAAQLGRRTAAPTPPPQRGAVPGAKPLFSSTPPDNRDTVQASAPAPASGSSTAPAPRDPNVLRSGTAIQEPVPLDEVQVPKIGPLSEPIDAYLLQKENGPFMVTAYTFRGPEAAKYAQILAMELRREYHLPAYIWLARVQPMRSNIYKVQPTAPDFARNGDAAPPEKYRQYDEAAVLVGNCKTIDESETLLKKQVKHIVPHCLKDFPVIYQNRRGKGLNRATLTTNPFQGAQNIYPGSGIAAGGPALKQGQAFDPFVAAAKLEQTRKLDPQVRKWNSGPSSIFKNPGSYTLQVAEYTGRTNVLASGDAIPDDKESLKRSPLQTAADDAERLAEGLNKCKSMGNLKAYVYHTRYSSIVTVGSFNTPNDPTSRAVREKLTTVSNELVQRGFSQIFLRPSSDLMPAPKDQ